MKFILNFALIIMFSPFCIGQQQRVSVPAGEEVQLRFSTEESTEVTLHNPSGSTLDARVLRDSDGKFVRGFGLGKSSKEKICVESDAILFLRNDSEKEIEVSYETSTESSKGDFQSQGVNLTFHNGSLASIPLIIPGVMNPNLSPQSNSGVTLEYGQKVFFKEKGKQYLLFEVDETFKNGDVLEIQDLIKARKKQLDI